MSESQKRSQNPIDAFLNAQPVRARQVFVVFIVSLALIIDGLDTQLLALTAPLILKEWELARAQFGPAMAAALVGMSIGASVGGWLGDRYGRKVVLVFSAFEFGAATLVASLTGNVLEMSIARLVSGIGFGAAQPNGIALATEWLPERARARAVSILSIGTPLGGMVGAGVLIFLLPMYGWRGTFVACGALTIAIAAVMVVGLHESSSYLLARGKRSDVSRLLKIVARSTGPIPEVQIAPADRARRHVSARIFTRANMRFNAGVWLCFFGTSFIAYAIAAWTPVLLTTAGLRLSEALQGSLGFNVSAVTAAVLAGFLLTRFGSRAVIAWSCAGMLASIALLAGALNWPDITATSPLRWVVILACTGAGGSTGTAIASIYTLLASSYGLACRASGIGFGLMMGRIGAIASTLSGGFLLSIEGSSSMPFFLTLAFFALLAFVGFLIVDRHVPASPRAAIHEPRRR